MPDEPEGLGLLALMLLHDARREARTGRRRARPARGPGSIALGPRRDRRGPGAARPGAAPGPARRLPGPGGDRRAPRRGRTAGDTDWRQIAALYARLAGLAPSPVVELNRAVAIAMADGPEAGLALLDALAADERLATYPYFHSARADLLRRLGRRAAAAGAYRAALALTSNEVERAFLTRRLAEVEGPARLN